MARSIEKKKLNVLHVAEILKGGIATYLNEILELQSNSDLIHKLAVLAPKSQKEYLNNFPHVKIFYFNDFRLRVLNVLSLYFTFIQIFFRSEFNIVHLHSTFAGFSVRLFYGLFRSSKIKIIYCSHGWAFDRNVAEWKNRLLVHVEKILAFGCDKIICISKHDFLMAKNNNVGSSKLVIVQNSIKNIELPISNIDWPEEKLRVLFAGRFDRQKGVDIFFSAMSQLQNIVYAYAAGDQSSGDQSYIEPPSNVNLLGWTQHDKLQQYFVSCDVFVIPSRWEGFGLSALEAMRASKPVIASNVGGLPELIEHGVTGYLIPSNSVDDLVNSLKSLTPELCKEMGSNAREKYLKYFTSERLSREILDLYLN